MPFKTLLIIFCTSVLYGLYPFKPFMMIDILSLSALVYGYALNADKFCDVYVEKYFKNTQTVTKK